MVWFKMNVRVYVVVAYILVYAGDRVEIYD